MGDLFTALSAPFPANEIEWRVGSMTQDKKKGMALAYLTARHVMDRLDGVLGPANWQDRYEFHGARTVCYLSIRLGDEWITKADGAGDSDVEAEKGAISDALKRAAVKWGIGRYLYDLGSTWVELDDYKKIKPDQYSKLDKALFDLMNGGLVPERTPKLRTVANEKEAYDRLRGEMMQESANGSKALTKWVNDPSVLADINSLERYGADLKREFKGIFASSVAAEKNNTVAFVPPNFDSMDTSQ